MNHILLISSYPPKGSTHSDKVSGLAAFAKNKVEAMPDTAFTVLADIHTEPETSEEGKNTVIRCWRRGSYLLYWQLIRQLSKYRAQTNHLLIEFEFATFGGPILTGFMPALLIIARLMDLRPTLVVHQVLSDFSDLSTHLGIKQNSLKHSIVRWLMKQYYRVLCATAQHIIVHDEIHRQKLAAFTNKDKVSVIPLGVELKTISPDLTQKITVKQHERREQGIFTVMSFGFLAWYKGSDIAAREFSKQQTNNPPLPLQPRLILAGGQSPTQKDSPAYQMFYADLQKTATTAGDLVHMTGFIPENELESCFIGSDLVIFPYRVLMSSSGPLALAFSYERPFLLSSVLKPYTETQDFKESLHDAGLTPQDIVFDLTEGALMVKIKEILAQPDLLNRMTHLSRLLKQRRAWEVIGKQYESLLFTQPAPNITQQEIGGSDRS